MKTTAKNRIKIAAVLSIGLVVTVVLTSFTAFKGRKFRGFEQPKDMVEYITNNVLPVIQEKRNAFDQYLSSDEKQKVAELQHRLSVLHEERAETFQNRAGQGRFGQGEWPEFSDEQRDLRQAHMKERRLIMTEAWAIADHHESELENIQESLRPEIEKWREDIRDLMEPYRAQRQENCEVWRGKRGQVGNNYQGQGRRGSYGRGPGSRGMGRGPAGGGGMFMQYSSAPMFVLFDSELATAQITNLESKVANVFPNPTDGTARIQFELAQNERVIINIYDNQGNLISTVLDDVKEKGVNEISVDLSGFERGLYFYEIESTSISQKGRIIKH